MWSDQYDWKIQIVGHTGSDHWTMVGDPAQDRFAVVYGESQGQAEGAVIVNWPRALVDARRSVASRAKADELIHRLRALLEPSSTAPAKAAAR